MNMSIRLCEDIISEFYTHNRFISDAGIRIGDVQVDISQITVPCYFVSTQGDHIAPWESCFAGVTKVNGDSYFVLGKSGHVAGIINPPEQNKYGFWHGRPQAGEAGSEWKQHATYHPGSWWGNWEQWLQSHDKGKRRAPPPRAHMAASPGKAPGNYVLEKCSVTGTNGLSRHP